MCSPNILFMFAFIFYCRSFLPWWPLAFLIFSPPLWISMFFFLRNSSPLFSMTRSGSQSLLKNNAEKDMTLLLFFLSKSPGAHVISSQIKPWVAFGFPYLSIACGAYGRSLARSVYGHVITKFSEMGRLPHFLCYELRCKVSWPVKGSRYQTQIGIYRKQSFVLFYFLFCISSLDFICLLGLEDDTNIQQITESIRKHSQRKRVVKIL